MTHDAWLYWVGDANPQSRQRWAVRVGDGTVWKSIGVWWVPIPSIQIISINTRLTKILHCSLGWGYKPQPWARGGHWGLRWYHSKEHWWVLIGGQLFVYLYAFQRYCCFCAPARHFFPTPFLVFPKFPHVPQSPGNRCMAYNERRCWANCLCS